MVSHISENHFIEAMTDVCEWAKTEGNGFVWLTHTGHFRKPHITAVFSTEQQRIAAIESNWQQQFEQQIFDALDWLGIEPLSIQYDSEQACNQFSDGNWTRHLRRKVH